MAKGNILTGCRARFSLNGVKVGYATNVTLTENIERQPIEVLDNVEVAEFVPTAYRVTMRASFFRIVGNTIKGNGWFPATGKDPAEHLTNILNSGDLVATLEDSKTGMVLANVTGVQIASHNYTITARGVVGEDAEFVAIRMIDETEI